MKIDRLNFNIEDGYSRFIEKINRNEFFVRWGIDNMEIERWYDYCDFSPIHAACIRSKVDNGAGKGFTNDYKINNKESINDVVKQIFWEFVVGGNLFLEILWKNDRKEGIAGFHVIPSKYMRAKTPENGEIRSDKWLYCQDWLNYKRAGVIEFSEFDPKDYTTRQIIHIKQYQPGYVYYGVPTWLSSALDVRLSRAISEFNLSNISNGASPSMWIHMPTEAPDSQNDQEDVLRRLEERYRGSANAGRIIVSYGGEGGKPEITQITPTMQTGGYAEIFALVRENILSGHQIPDPSLIGLPQPSGFSSQADQLTTAFNLYMNTTIKPMQEFLIREIEPVIQLMYPNQQIKLEINQNQILS